MDFKILILTSIFILFDLISGFASAVYLKDVSSDKLRKGLWHKAGFFGLIALGYLLEVATKHADLGFEVPAVLAICIYIIITESVSVFENLCIVNPGIINSPLGSLFKKSNGVEKAEQLEEENEEEKKERVGNERY